METEKWRETRDEAIKELTELQRANPKLAPLAGAIIDLMRLGVPLSVEEMQGLLRQFAELAADIGKSVKRVPSKKIAYKTPAFKCLDDFEACCKDRPKPLCVALVVLCMLRQIIPLAPHS